jgi:hypothetical protein
MVGASGSIHLWIDTRELKTGRFTIVGQTLQPTKANSLNSLDGTVKIIDL